jgi:phosphoglycerol transferase MdoB-like AlkP superfamily enzyme
MTTDYLQSIHYVDSVFGDFYKKLSDECILDDSIIVIYGDHEGIHKYYQTDLPDNNREIPFIIHSKNIDGIKLDKLGGQVDMMPTLAYLLGIERNRYMFNAMGRNLFNKYSGSPVYTTGDVSESADYIDHLLEAIHISDIAIRGNYQSGMLFK